MDVPCWEVMYGACSSVRDDACATIDTGCQRTAIGLDTLKRMKPFWPADLTWFRQTETNRFRSVNGVSQTDFNAVIPCGLGKKGCYMKPAVFSEEQSRKAPFLISLQFLLRCEAVISLARNRLELHLTKCGTVVPLRIGPSGALRIPMNLFNQDMFKSLKKAESKIEDHRKPDFEILNLAQDCSPGDFVSPISCDSHRHGHGRRQQQRPRPSNVNQDRIYQMWRSMMVRLLCLLRPVTNLVITMVKGSSKTMATQTEGADLMSPSTQCAAASSQGPGTRWAPRPTSSSTTSLPRPGGPPPPTAAGTRISTAPPFSVEPATPSPTPSCRSATTTRSQRQAPR